MKKYISHLFCNASSTNNFLYDERVGPKVVLHPGGHSKNIKDIIGKNIRYKNLNKNLEKIKSKKYNLLLENMPPYPWYFGGAFFQHIFTDSFEIKKFCKETNTNVIKINKILLVFQKIY